MELSHELISQFAKVVNTEKKTNTESTVYGTVVTDGNGNKYVKLDGSDQLTPLSNDERPAADTSTTNSKEGDRVSVLIKNHTATVTGNISSPSVRTQDFDDQVSELTKVDILLADKIQANEGYIKNLQADKANVGDLTAATARITELEAKDVTITGELDAAKADITDLKTTKLDAEDADIKYATIENLDATNANIGSLDAEIGDINTLIFGSASGGTMQVSFANAVIALLGDAWIKSAMVDSLDASKINAGTINTNNVKIESSEGHLTISDNTIQISDGTNVRVQIGKDASNDYSINIFDSNGNLMFSEGGITDKAIKNAIIRNDMVTDDANIDAKKLNILSLFTEINGSTETIKSSKIYVDSESQTLDIVFKNLDDTITAQGETITSQGTQITAIQGNIDSKIWQQDIDKSIETSETNMNTKYSELEQNLEGFKTTVNETNTTLQNNIDTVQDNVDALVTRVSTAETSIEQNTEEIALRATKTEVTKAIDDIQIGGRNLLVGTSVPITHTGTGSTNECTDLYNISDYYIKLPNLDGEQLTLSFEWETTATSGTFVILLNDTPWTSLSETITVSSNDNGKNINTVIANSGFDTGNYWGVKIRSDNLTGDITIKNMMFEKGNKASSWQPAPEDVDDNINDTAESLNTTLSKTITDYVSTIQENSDSISLSVQALETKVNDSTDDLQSKIDTLSEKVDLQITEDQVNIQIEQKLQNGVNKVETSTGFKFDENGLNINKSGSPTNTQITENGMTVNNTESGEAVLTANKDGVDAVNLRAKTYLIIGGRSRFENYGTNRTGCFWIGE